jgi:hypothetical protein
MQALEHAPLQPPGSDGAQTLGGGLRISLRDLQNAIDNADKRHAISYAKVRTTHRPSYVMSRWISQLLEKAPWWHDRTSECGDSARRTPKTQWLTRTSWRACCPPCEVHGMCNGVAVGFVFIGCVLS